MTLKGKRAGCLLWIGMLLAAFLIFSLSAFIPLNECQSDITGSGTWQHEADGSCWYIHSEYEFDNDKGCVNCHDEPAQVYEFVPDLRIRLSDGKLVSVLEVNGTACKLWGGEVVPCSTVVKPPMFGIDQVYGMK